MWQTSSPGSDLRHPSLESGCRKARLGVWLCGWQSDNEAVILSFVFYLCFEFLLSTSQTTYLKIFLSTVNMRERKKYIDR